MEDLKLIIDYKNNNNYRYSFNELAKNTFGINFEKWYNLGFWNDNYICYSYFANNSIISNVSASLIDLVINNQNYKAILIGTVMTHLDFRNQGLSLEYFYK